MTIVKTVNEDNITLNISGRLDCTTSDQLSAELESIFLSGACNLHFNLKDLDYISSSGLRVLIVTQKKVKSLGTKLELSGVNDSVKSVLDMTGFSNILTIIE